MRKFIKLGSVLLILALVLGTCAAVVSFAEAGKQEPQKKELLEFKDTIFVSETVMVFIGTTAQGEDVVVVCLKGKEARDLSREFGANGTSFYFEQYKLLVLLDTSTEI